MHEADAHVGDALPPGWCRDEAGLIRRGTVHSMLRRLPGWDYRKPWICQITLVCANRPQGRILVREKGGERWLPLVTMHDKGFSNLQKPSGRYFDALARQAAKVAL